MLLTRKRSGKTKGRLAYNGKKTRNWISHEDKSSPTVHTEALFLTVAVDAHQRRDIMSLDIPNAYIQTQLPEKKRGERVVMKIRGLLVEWLVTIDPISYAPFVVMERGVKTLYLLICKAIYGMLEAGLHW